MNYLFTRFVLPAGIVLVGVLFAVILFAAGPRTTPDAGVRTALPVEVVTVAPETAAALIRGTGVVEPDQQVRLVPEVSGRITWVSDRLRPGGRFERGEALAKIDDRDYEATMLAEEARLRQAEVELQLERERQIHAKRQWELLGDERNEESAKLALRKPQLALAEANLEGAKASLERAQRNERRTALVAPFDAVVLSESLDVGQMVASGASGVADLAGTERFRVPVSVPVEQLGLIDIPALNASEGSGVTIRQSLGGQPREWQGVVSGLQGQLDPATRTAVLLVTIDSPLDTVEEGQLPLLPGAFVDVGITGRTQPDLYAIPREALDEDTHVWVIQEDALHRVEVRIAFGDERTVYVSSGLEPGMKVVTSRIGTPIEGQPVMVSERAPTVGAFERRE